MRFGSAAAAAGLLLFFGPAAWADEPSAARRCLTQLQAALDALPESPSGYAEISREREDVLDLRSAVERDVKTHDELLSDVKAVRSRIDFDRRDLDQKAKEIDREEEQVRGQIEDNFRRGQTHEADRIQQWACNGSTNEQVRRCNEWGEEVTRRANLLNSEMRELEARQKQLQARRLDLVQKGKDILRRSVALQRKHVLAESDVFGTTANCEDALARTRAFGEIVRSPAPGSRPIESYPTVSQAAEEAAKTLFTESVKTAATRTLEGKTGERVLSKVKVLGRIGIRGVPIGAAFTVADVSGSVLTAGVDARTKEIEKDLWLVGDYGAALKRIIETKGEHASEDPGYQAVLRALRDKQGDFPATGPQVAAEGLVEVTAFTTLFAEAAAKYASRPLKNAGWTWWRHLNNADRKAWAGNAGKFRRETVGTLAETLSEEATKNGLRSMTDQLTSPSEIEPYEGGDPSIDLLP